MAKSTLWTLFHVPQTIPWTIFTVWQDVLPCWCIILPLLLGNTLVMKGSIWSATVFKLVVSSTWMTAPKVSQQNIAKGITLHLSACLLPIVHPAVIFSLVKSHTGNLVLYICKRIHDSVQAIFFRCSMIQFWCMSIVGTFSSVQRSAWALCLDCGYRAPYTASCHVRKCSVFHHGQH